MPTRREILQWAAALATLPALGRAQTPAERAKKPLDILFLGGTGFLGPHQVEYALARGHRVTLFNRGKTAPNLYGERAEVLLGDRDSKTAPGLAALEGTRRWDVVIDNSGYIPRHVHDSVELLKARCGRYIYVSTVAVYDPAKGTKFDETSALRPAPEPATEKVTGASYGPLKAECDRIVHAALGAKATIVRPTYIVGPGDETDRFTYWVERMARGGEVLGPPNPAAELQWIDARDLCPWIVDLAERDLSGIFNAAGPSTAVTWEKVLTELAKGSAQPASVKWSTNAALDKTGIQLPLVRQPFFGGADSLHFDSSAALVAGLRFRSLEDTAAATRAWWSQEPQEHRAKPKGWPSAAQEQETLKLLG
ncbi:MAG: NAD-dependent epimerase/dehydratase family protein [Planctomycetes bacterium]|nr:NAD-dependent epimerase/dehydratase family protein [Planctomycetota bacterium]